MVFFNKYFDTLMKNLRFLIFIIPIFSLYMACNTLPVVEKLQQIANNTFQAIIINNSPFIAIIDGKIIKKGEAIKNSFLLMKGTLYDDWFVNYRIPLSKDVFYLHKEKIAITNNQETVVIESPIDNSIREVYVVVKNTSKQSIELTDGMYGLLPSCLNGMINTYVVQKEYNISPSNVAVYEILTEEEMQKRRVFVSQGNKSYSLLQNTSLRNGYVYTYSFDGVQVIKEDERPLLKIGEPLWKQSGADGVSVSKIMSAPAGDIFYAVGKVRKKDANSNPYDSGFIQCTENSGKERWMCYFEETGCDAAVYDGIALENGDLLAAGHTSGDEQNGLLLLYSRDGVLLNTQKITGSSGFESVIPFIDGAFLVTGFDGENKLMFGKVHIENNVIRYAPFSVLLPFAETEFVTRAISLYDNRTKTLFVCCNLLDMETELSLPSALFALAEDGAAKRILLKYVIKSVATVRQDANGILYIGGETGAAEHSTAMIVTVDAAQNKQTAFYTGGAPYAYIADMQLNKKSGELIIAGTEKATDNFGNGGTPFFKSIALSSGKELWTAGYPDKTYELLSSFIPCTDYGFIATFTAIDENGEYAPPLCTARLSATGKMGK